MRLHHDLHKLRLVSIFGNLVPKRERTFHTHARVQQLCVCAFIVLYAHLHAHAHTPRLVINGIATRSISAKYLLPYDRMRGGYGRSVVAASGHALCDCLYNLYNLYTHTRARNTYTYTRVG